MRIKCWLPQSAVDIRGVKAWYQASTGWTGNYFMVGDYSQKFVPELLLKNASLVQVDRVEQKNYLKVNRGAGDELVWVNIPGLLNESCFKTADFPLADSDTLQPIDLPKEQTQQLWLTVQVPESTLAGPYTGEVIIRAGGQELTWITLRVIVPDIHLADHAAGVYYTSRLDPANATLGSGAKTETQMGAEFRNLWEHGVKDFTHYQPLSQLESVLQLRQTVGLPGRQALYTTVSASSPLATLNTTVPQLLEVAQRYGFTDAFFYGVDEASGAELEAQRPSWQRVHELGGKIFVAGYNDAFDYVGDLLDTLVHARRPRPEYAAQWHGAGQKIFSYGNPQSGSENPYPYRRNYGVVLWAAGYDQACTWAYQAVRGNQWNDFDASRPPDPGRTTQYREENFTYSTATGVIDTLAWEGYREAIDDIRYLKKLEQTIAQARTNHSPIIQAAVSEAQTYLNQLRHTTLEAAGTGPHVANFTADLTQLRKDIIQQVGMIKASQAEAERQAYWEKIPNREIVAFPNPAREQVTFRWREATNQCVEIYVYNIAGRLVAKLTTDQARSTQLSWNVRSLAAGIYVFHTVLTDAQGAMKKLGSQKLGITH